MTFTPTSICELDLDLNIVSNDPDDGTKKVRLLGTGAIAPEIQVNRDSLLTDLYSGDMLSTKLKISNAGASDLTIRIRTENYFGRAGMENANGGINLDSEIRVGGVMGANKISIPKNYGDSRTGEVLRTIPAPASITGLTYMDGSLWAISDDWPIGGIVRFDPENGSMLSSFSTPGYEIRSLASDGTNLWASDFNNQKVVKYDRTGTRLAAWDFSVAPLGITCDGSTLWINAEDSPTIYHVDTLGNIIGTKELGLDYGSNIRDLVWVPWHSPCQLWLADMHNDMIAQFNIFGDTAAICQAFSSPEEGITAITHDGENLWMCGSYRAKIYLVDDGIDESAWLRVDPNECIIPGGDSSSITVTFDATGLIGADYKGRVVIGSNDPANPEIEVPVRLHVTGAPTYSSQQRLGGFRGSIRWRFCT